MRSNKDVRFKMPSSTISPSEIVNNLIVPPQYGSYVTANKPSVTQARLIERSNVQHRYSDSLLPNTRPTYAEVVGGVTGMGIGPNGFDPSGRMNAYGGDIVDKMRGSLKRPRFETDEAIVTGPVLPSALQSDNTSGKIESSLSSSSSSSSSGEQNLPPPVLVPLLQKIDSSQRDQTSYPNDNSYKIIFPTVENVVRVRINEAVIPNAQYNIYSFANTIYFTEKTGVTETNYSATMTNGNYDTTTLPTEIARAMNAAVNLTWTCTYNDTTEKLTITRGDGAGTFKFKWATNASSNLSAQEQLGFAKADSTSYATSQTSDNIVQLSGPNYIEVDIDEFTSSGPSSKTMATFQLDQATGYACFNTMNSQVRCFRTPLRFSTVTAKFYNPVSSVSGQRNLFNFNGTPNCFTIEFLTLQS